MSRERWGNSVNLCSLTHNTNSLILSPLKGISTIIISGRFDEAYGSLAIGTDQNIDLINLQDREFYQYEPSG
ncbi:MAG: hypothetical protein Q7J12_05055, partial [Syntrophales bacterium]|nr:hypothetical protein [Syntrophales bacterium]